MRTIHSFTFSEHEDCRSGKGWYRYKMVVHAINSRRFSNQQNGGKSTHIMIHQVQCAEFALGLVRLAI